MRVVRVILAVAIVSAGLLRPLAAEPVVGEFRLERSLSAAARAELAALAADSGGQVRWREADGAVHVRAAEWADRFGAWARRHHVEVPPGAAGERPATLAPAEAVLAERPSDRQLPAETPLLCPAAVALGSPGPWRPAGSADAPVLPSSARSGACGSRAPPIG